MNDKESERLKRSPAVIMAAAARLVTTSQFTQDEPEEPETRLALRFQPDDIDYGPAIFVIEIINEAYGTRTIAEYQSDFGLEAHAALQHIAKQWNLKPETHPDNNRLYQERLDRIKRQHLEEIRRREEHRRRQLCVYAYGHDPLEDEIPF